MLCRFLRSAAPLAAIFAVDGCGEGSWVMAAFSPFIRAAAEAQVGRLAKRETLHIFQPERRNNVAQVRRLA
jgi:hypothetical protein